MALGVPEAVARMLEHAGLRVDAVSRDDVDPGALSCSPLIVGPLADEVARERAWLTVASLSEDFDLTAVALIAPGETPDELVAEHASEILPCSASPFIARRIERYLRKRSHGSVDPAIAERLAEALEAGEFVAHFQPKACAVTRAIVGFEALVRWDHPERGWVGPASFIGDIEAAGYAPLLFQTVLARACEMSCRWSEADLFSGRIAVNLSPLQFEEPTLVGDTLGIIDRAGASRESIELEITEGCFTEGATAAPVLEELRSYGVSIAIDDFGTGYSSLQYLRTLPADAIKIDRAFIADLEHGESARGMVAAIISLGWSLGLRVVAEGVETEDQWEFLADHGVDSIQGYCFSRPLEAAACELLLRDDAARR